MKARYIVLVLVALMGAGMPHIPIDEKYAMGSIVSILLFALPSFSAALQFHRKKGIITLIALSIYALLFENIAILTGFPYGVFHYTDLIGIKIGTVPFTVALAWVPLILGTYYLAQRYADSKVGVIGLSAGLLVAFDMVLDPASVALNFWIWKTPGLYYGIPLTNFVGWFLSGALGTLILEKLVNKQPPQGFVKSLLFITTFWAFVAVSLGQIVPFIIGCGLIYLIEYDLWKKK